MFEFDFGSENFALAQQSDLDAFAKKRLMAIVDEVFSAAGQVGDVCKIERLEVDLGTVRGTDYREQLCSRLREDLNDALSEQIVASQVKQTDGVSMATRRSADFAQLEHFLISGHLPWNANGQDDGLIEQLLSDALRSDSQRLIALLRTSADRPRMLARLVSQFPQHLLTSVLDILAPTQAQTLVSLIETQAAATPQRLSEREVWASAIGELLDRNDNARTQPGQLFEGAIGKLAPPEPLAHDIECEPSGTPSKTLPAARAIARGQRLIRGHELFEEVTTCVDSAPPTGLSESIDELMSDHPIQLFRLYRALQRGVLSTRALVASLPGSSIRRLTQRFVKLLQPSKTIEPAELFQAIDRYAQKAVAPEEYHVQLLERLLHDEPIDFEALMVAEATETEFGGARPRQPTPAPSPETCDSWIALSPLEGERRVADYLRRPNAPSSTETVSFSNLIRRMLREQPERLRQLVQGSIGHPLAIERLVAPLPESLLSRLLLLLRPTEHHWLQSHADLITLSISESIKDVASEGDLRLWKWEVIFEFVRSESRLALRAFIQHILDKAAHVYGLTDTVASRIVLGSEFASSMLPRIAPSVRSELATALATVSGAYAADEINRPASPSSPVDGMRAAGDTVSMEYIYIANAGQVLAAPYLPSLFDRLELLLDGHFRSSGHAERAAHLLQVMVDERTNAPEHQLVLNKILCGLGTAEPIDREVVIGADERALVDSLLDGMIQNWKSVGNTSVAGLRDAFFQREGRLERQGDSWHLLVETRPYDMLLDQLPWSITPIRHAWMTTTLHVTWR